MQTKDAEEWRPILEPAFESVCGYCGIESLQADHVTHMFIRVKVVLQQVSPGISRFLRWPRANLTQPGRRSSDGLISSFLSTQKLHIFYSGQGTLLSHSISVFKGPDLLKNCGS